MKFERLKELRSEQGLTQKNIGKILNISRQLYSRYERGTQKIPIKHLIALSRYCNVSVDYLLNLSDKKRPVDRSLQD